MSEITRLSQLKEAIDAADARVYVHKERKKSLMEELKNDWKCATVDAAEKKIVKIQTEVEKLSSEINDLINEINEKYELW